jgi:hypothetical protein
MPKTVTAISTRTRNGMKSPKSSIAARDATGRRLCANQPAKSSEMRTYR